MQTSVDIITRNGMTAVIYVDDTCDSPRDTCDNLWHLVSNCRSIGLSEGDLSLDELMTDRKRLERDYIIVPVYMYRHSGVALSLTPFYCPWDSGLGFVTYVSKAELRKEYGKKIVTPKVKETALNVLKGEVEEYGMWLNGECFGVVVTNDEDESEVESCWGFIGEDWAKEYANEILGEDKSKVA